MVGDLIAVRHSGERKGLSSHQAPAERDKDSMNLLRMEHETYLSNMCWVEECHITMSLSIEWGPPPFKTLNLSENEQS